MCTCKPYGGGGPKPTSKIDRGNYMFVEAAVRVGMRAFPTATLVKLRSCHTKIGPPKSGPQREATFETSYNVHP